jgi:hypothetical protein
MSQYQKKKYSTTRRASQPCPIKWRRNYEPERTLARVLCSDATESIADFVNQLIPTLSYADL